MQVTFINSVLTEVSQIVNWGDGDPRRDVILLDGRKIIDGGNNCCNLCGNFRETTFVGSYQLCINCYRDYFRR